MHVVVATFILTWNPDGTGMATDFYAAEAKRGLAGEKKRWTRWSTGQRRSGIVGGERWLLLRQHHERGVIAAGTFVGPVFQDEHWEVEGGVANYAPLVWETMLDLDERLPVESLKAEVPSVNWDRIQGSGVQVPAAVEPDLLDLFDRHLVMVGRGEPLHPEEVVPGEYVEGAVSKITVNRYERDPKARAACLAAHGTRCAVCGFDFGSTYGPEGDGVIVVHHLKEISTLGGAYAINPREDLRPVCANCHVILHRRTPAYSIKEVQRMLAPST